MFTVKLFAFLKSNISNVRQRTGQPVITQRRTGRLATLLSAVVPTAATPTHLAARCTGTGNEASRRIDNMVLQIFILAKPTRT